MLDLNACSIMESRLMPLASTVGVLEEGVPMIHILEAGIGVVAPATGASGEKFAGVSQAKHIRPTKGKMVEELVVPASGTYAVTLSRTPSGSASDRAVFNAAGTALTSAGSVDANTKYNLTGKIVTVHSDLAGTTIKIVYDYDLLASETALLFGGGDFGILDTMAAKNITTITVGHIYTSCYDPGTNWSTPNLAIKLGAGVFTSAGSGGAVDAVVIKVPLAGDSMLGLYLHP